MGSVVISIDAELGWGFHDLADPPVHRVEAARGGWETLLDILEAYQIPATWAIVEHLMLEECDGVHADHPSIDGWFDAERGWFRDRPELRFGTDLVQRVLDSTASHEVACHTFSHLVLDDPRVTNEMVEAELRAATEAAARFDLTFDSLVFPRNGVGHRDLLGKYGISTYRIESPTPTGRLNRAVGKLVAAAAPDRLELVEPVVDEFGLLDVSPSLYLFGFEGWPRRLASSLGTDPIVRQARHGIDRACREDGVFHMWLHPNNLVTDQNVRRIRSIVSHLASRRLETDLRVETMADVGRRIL